MEVKVFESNKKYKKVIDYIIDDSKDSYLNIKQLEESYYFLMDWSGKNKIVNGPFNWDESIKTKYFCDLNYFLKFQQTNNLSKKDLFLNLYKKRLQNIIIKKIY